MQSHDMICIPTGTNGLIIKDVLEQPILFPQTSKLSQVMMIGPFFLSIISIYFHYQADLYIVYKYKYIYFSFDDFKTKIFSHTKLYKKTKQTETKKNNEDDDDQFYWDKISVF
jgi:hypothetical protein